MGRNWMAKNEIGNRYGRLVVISQVEGRKYNQLIWLCQCDCGNTKEITGNSLRRGHTQSCGCFQKEQKVKKLGLGGSEYGLNRYYRAIKRGAESRGYSFNLTKEQVKILSAKNCFYCGCPPSNGTWTSNHRKHREPFIYNGIDRIDNSIGYEINNVVTSCKKCNYAKNKFSVYEFKDWITRVYNHLISPYI